MFNNLVIFEMANNHQGSLKHGLKIIDTYSNISKNLFNPAIKLQYRDLNTFISKTELKAKKNKHVDRFISTKLERDEFKIFCNKIKSNNLKLIITPFDEVSVNYAIEDGVDILKIASCSANDWPLIEKIAMTKKPVIFSTGGQDLNSIDKLYSFFSHKSIEFAIMHCVSIYPSEFNDAQISFIKRLKKRYPNVPIGYSGHESPNDNSTIKVAIGCGAKLFERHVGIKNKNIKLNSYSMDPAQTSNWIRSINNSFTILGTKSNKEISKLEKKSIMDLQRGVFLSKNINKGKKIKFNDIYFAFPLQKDQISSGEFVENIVASKNYKKNSPLKQDVKQRNSKIIRSYIHQYKGLFNENNVVVGNSEQIELSHHNGINKFSKTGCILITIINKIYCKKLVGLLPGQKHPNHRHFRKNESFHILSGEITLLLNDIKYLLKKGDVIHINKGTWHSFYSDKGCIFEEVSSRYIVGDSEYKEQKINNLDPYERKTKIDQW